jgi:hypothetical protein
MGRACLVAADVEEALEAELEAEVEVGTLEKEEDGEIVLDVAFVEERRL